MAKTGTVQGADTYREPDVTLGIAALPPGARLITDHPVNNLDRLWSFARTVTEMACGARNATRQAWPGRVRRNGRRFQAVADHR